MAVSKSVSTFLMTLVISCVICNETHAYAIGENLDDSESNAAEYADYELQKPMPKRAALLLDKLLVALQKAVENEELGRDGTKTYVRTIPDFSSDVSDSQMQFSNEKSMDLQRRGQAKGRVYWRCYFNAVSCFKRK